jgi:hypothetical protein
LFYRNKNNSLVREKRSFAKTGSGLIKNTHAESLILSLSWQMIALKTIWKRLRLRREIGVWEKQSSAFFQAKAAQSLLKGNVVFNLARAGFNFVRARSSWQRSAQAAECLSASDRAHCLVLSCLVWLRMTALAAATTSLRTFCFTPAASRAITAQSTLGIVKCVKTGRPFPTCFTPFNTNDHLPRQARDRHKESTQKRPFFSQPFLTTVRTGKPSTQMEWRHVHNNIVIANYGACEQNAGFCAIWYWTMIILPRQARDKHSNIGKALKKRVAVSQVAQSRLTMTMAASSGKFIRILWRMAGVRSSNAAELSPLTTSRRLSISGASLTRAVSLVRRGRRPARTQVQ